MSDIERRKILYPDLARVEDWLNAKGYTGEAGAVHVAMDEILEGNIEITRLREENARYKLTYQQYVEATDRMNGTPCEQIRHQQEVDALLEENARLRKLLFDFENFQEIYEKAMEAK